MWGVSLTLFLIGCIHFDVVTAQNLTPAFTPDPATISVCFNASSVSVRQQVEIGWTSYNLYPPSSVHIDVLRDNAVVTRIADGIANEGSFSWRPTDSGIQVISNQNATGWTLRVTSAEEPAVFAASGTFAFKLSGATTTADAFVERDDPAYLSSATVIQGSFGMPFNRLWNGQRWASMYYYEDFNSTADAVLLTSIAPRLRFWPDADVENFRVDYAILPSTVNQFFFNTPFPLTIPAVAPKTITAADLSNFNDTFFPVQFDKPILLQRGQNIVFELSSTASTRDEIACSVYVGQTARLRTKKAYSDDWVGIPYPYPDLTVYTRRFVMVAKFGVDSIVLQMNPSCGAAPVLQPIIDDFRWQLLGAAASDTCGGDALPACRSFSSLVSYNNRLVLFGGSSIDTARTSQKYFNDLWVFRPSTRVWTKAIDTQDSTLCEFPQTQANATAPVQPSCRHKHSAVVIGDYMFLFGGTNTYGVLSELWRLDLALVIAGTYSGVWQRISNFVITDGIPNYLVRGSYDHCAVAIGTSMYIVGGIAEKASIVSSSGGTTAVVRGAEIRTDQIFRFNATDSTWSIVSGSPLTDASCTTPSRCVALHACAVALDSIYIVGGTTGNRTESTATNAVTTYNLTSLSWNEIIEKDCSNRNSLPCRSSHQLIVRDNRLVVFGGGPVVSSGQTSAGSNDLWQFNISSGAWLRTRGEVCSNTRAGPSCVTAHSATQIGETLFVFGGINTGGGATESNQLWGQRIVPAVIVPNGALPAVTVSGGTPISITGRNFGTNTSLLTVSSSRANGPILACTAVRNVSGGSQLPTSGEATIVCNTSAGVGSKMFVTVNLQDLGSWPSDPAALYSYNPPSITNISLLSNTTTDTMGLGQLEVFGVDFGLDASARPSVAIGGVPCRVTEQFTGVLRCGVPAGSGSGLQVEIAVADQVSVPAGKTFNYSKPEILEYSVDNTKGLPTAGGGVISLFGRYLGRIGLNATIAYIQGTPCASTRTTTIGQLEPEQGRSPSFVESIQCVMAPGAGSNLTVTVSVGGQLSAPAPFNISYDAPRIKSVAFDDAPTQGGSVLTVFGYDFGPATTSSPVVLLVEGRPCANTAVLGPARRINEPFPILDARGRVETEVQCDVPAGSGGNLSVAVSSNGQVSVASAVQFQYLAPRVTAVSPKDLYLNRVNRITVDGANFGASAASAALTIEGRLCASLSVREPHVSLTCEAPKFQDQGLYSVVVSVSGQASQALLVYIGYEPIILSTLIVIFVLTGLAMVFVLSLLGLIFYNRRQRIIRASSLLFSTIILIGGIVSLSTIFFLGDRTAPFCFVTIYLIAVGSTLLYGTLVAKSYRILRLFRNRSLHSALISDMQLMVFLLSMVCLDILLLVPWTSTDQCLFPDGFALACLVILATIKFVMLTSGVVVAYQSRVVHLAEFNERITLGYAIYNTAFSALLMGLVIILFRDLDQEQFIIRSVAILVVTCVTVAILFVPKFYTVYYGDDQESVASGLGQSTRNVVSSTELMRGESVISLSKGNRRKSSDTTDDRRSSLQDLSNVQAVYKQYTAAPPMPQRTPSEPDLRKKASRGSIRDPYAKRPMKKQVSLNMEPMPAAEPTPPRYVEDVLSEASIPVGARQDSAPDDEDTMPNSTRFPSDMSRQVSDMSRQPSVSSHVRHGSDASVDGPADAASYSNTKAARASSPPMSPLMRAPSARNLPPLPPLPPLK